MCDGCIHLPVRASRFSPGACVHPPAIGARSCWCAVGESGEGGEKKREERRERKRGRNGEREVSGSIVQVQYSGIS